MKTETREASMTSHNGVKGSTGLFIFATGFLIMIGTYWRTSWRPDLILEQHISQPQELNRLLHLLGNRTFGQSYNVEYETIRRLVKQEVIAKWSGEKEKLKGEDLRLARKNFIASMAAIETFREQDGFDEQRMAKTSELASLIQDRLWRLQNPDDCSSARFLYCDKNFNIFCGWGCRVHHVLFCLVAAFGLNRTLILDESFYLIDQHFKPLSESCPDKWTTLPSGLRHFSKAPPNTPIVFTVPYQERRFGFGSYKDVFPYYLPAEIADDLSLVSPDPNAWYLGQFIKFILRPNEVFAKEAAAIQNNSAKAAIHVRRTDKLKSEAEAIDSDKYMDLVDEFYDIQDAKKGEKADRNLFLATDEPEIINEVVGAYPNYNVLANTSVAATGSTRHGRNSSLGTDGIIRDIFALASADFLACTMSSNVCRLAYELRLATRPIVADLDEVRSLDKSWFMWPFKNLDKEYRAVENAISPKSGALAFKAGDIITVKKTPSEDPGIGINHRTKERGDVTDWLKLREIPLISDKFPKFHK